MTKVKTYAKKPVKIKAMQWTGSNLIHIQQFITGKKINHDEHWEDYEDLVKTEGLKIHTLEGIMSANISDYIIQGVQGEFYPCKPDIFLLTYEEVNED